MALGPFSIVGASAAAMSDPDRLPKLMVTTDTYKQFAALCGIECCKQFGDVEGLRLIRDAVLWAENVDRYGYHEMAPYAPQFVYQEKLSSMANNNVRRQRMLEDLAEMIVNAYAGSVSHVDSGMAHDNVRKMRGICESVGLPDMTIVETTFLLLFR